MKTPMGNRRCFFIGGRRAARQPRLSKVRRLTRRRFMKVRIAAFCREFREIGHGKSRGERRRGGKAANAELPHEAFAFDLLFPFARGGFQFPRNTPTPRQTSPSARAALSHLRGAPHSALPNEAGGGEAAAPCRPAAPARAGRRAARQPRLSKVRRLTRRRFMKVRIAAFC